VDGVTGFIVPDSAGAVDAVKRLSQIDRKVCRNYFDLHFSDERMALEYMAIYEKLIHAEPSTLTIEDGVLSWTDLLPNSTT
jgi:hypothetical protein